jgi:hypothetical protein
MVRAKVQTHVVRSATYLLMASIIWMAVCVAGTVCVKAQDMQKQGGDESWTATRETTTPNTNPSRTTESHTRSGNRTVDRQRLEILGINGGYQPFSETETETVQVNATTTRTVVRRYQWDGNRRRILAHVTEEDSHTTASGDVRMESKTSKADLNGNFQVVRREVADTRKISPDVEETKSTVYLPDSYGGFAQAQQTQELKTHGADDSVSVKRTTLMPDLNGNWRVSDVIEKTIKDDSKNRTEERVSRPALEGRVCETPCTVPKETENATGEKRSTLETYSVSVPGFTDGGMHSNQRVMTIQKKTSGGELTDHQIKQSNTTTPSDSPKGTARTKYVVKYASPGTQEPKIPPRQKSEVPADKP